MTPETRLFLDKSHLLLREAEAMLGINLCEAAGRSAYLAGFHAAQAFISEETGRTVKTHNGLQTEFQRITKSDPNFPPDMRAFLSRTYNLKAIADYGTGPTATVSLEQATIALALAQRFVVHIAKLIETRTR